ncbi:hypothetical protein BCR39DRAFT_535500 [Naematelia encephala]|uniref:Uncharacterized protein n=1 Tax=Naematelia encephala TaxID=71784 RepID=A0A1Y2B0F3_9TREE|nr:hypothetical protein BCR39DRAFT_535500 [Naematelia encephala]
MPPPEVTIYVTSLTSQPKVRQHIELLRRSLKGLEIPFQEYDLVNEPEAKTRWQRAKPAGQVIGLPGYLVGGEFIGTMDDFEYAVESQTLPTFLRQDQETATLGGSTGEEELERLMREMSTGDLDDLAGQLGIEDQVIGKVGLLVPEKEESKVEEKKEGNAEEKEGEGGKEDVQETATDDLSESKIIGAVLSSGEESVEAEAKVEEKEEEKEEVEKISNADEGDASDKTKNEIKEKID